MEPHRVLASSALVLAMGVILSGCTFLEPISPAIPTPTPTVIDTKKYIGGKIDPANTVWSGKDSGGDDTTLTLHSDGTVAVSYGTNRYDYPGDTWYVLDTVLHVEVYLNMTDGLAEYSGTWNPETSALDTVMRTTKTTKQLTVTLARQ